MTATRDEHGPAAQVEPPRSPPGRRSAGASTSACSSKRGCGSAGTAPRGCRSRGSGAGRRTVSDMFATRTRPTTIDRVERPAVPEHRVRREHGRSPTRAGRGSGGSGRYCDRDGRFADRRGRSRRSTTTSAVALEQVAGDAAARAQRRARRAAARSAPRTIAPIEVVGQRPQPTFGAEEPDEHASRCGPRQEVGRGSSRPRTQRASSSDQASVRHMQQRRGASVSQPSAGRERDASRAASSGRGPRRAARPGRRSAYDRQLVLGEGVAQRAGALGGAARRRRRRRGDRLAGPRPRPRRVARVRSAAASSVTTTQATPRVAQRGQRPDPGRVERGRDDRPRSSRAGAGRR